MTRRILYIGHADTNGCRTTDYFPYLREQGAEPVYRGLPQERPGRLRLYDEAREYDLVFLQRRLLRRGEFARLRASARRLVYDFDDPVGTRRPRRGAVASLQRARRFARTVAAADAITVSNEALERQARAVAPDARVLVFPSTCAARSYPAKGRLPANSPVVLGWLGSSGSVRYLEALTPVLERLQASRAGAFVVRAVSDAFPDGVRYLLDCRPWAADREVGDLHGFDAALLPLPDDAWAAARGGGKLFRYMAAGLPVASSAVGTPLGILRDGEDGLFALSPGEWEGVLTRLIDDAVLRERLGRAARAAFETRHSVESHAPRVWAFLRDVAG